MKRIVISVAAISTFGAAASAQTAPTLPMRQGFYVPPTETCSAAVRGESVDGIVVRPRSFAFIDGVVDVTRIAKGTKGEFILTERTEDESGKFHNLSTKVRIVNPTSFVRSVPNGRN